MLCTRESDHKTLRLLMAIIRKAHNFNKQKKTAKCCTCRWNVRHRLISHINTTLYKKFQKLFCQCLYVTHAHVFPETSDARAPKYIVLVK